MIIPFFVLECFIRHFPPILNVFTNNFFNSNTLFFVITAPKLKNVPVIGEMVLSKYEDNNYYRAVITKIDGDKIFITYIDFGNVEVTTLTDMREMPNSLKQVCPFLVSTIPFTLKILEENFQY